MWLMLACANLVEPVDLGDCDDASCRMAWFEQAWETDREAIPSSLRALDDELERLVVTLSLVEAHPGETGHLCELLSDPSSTQRCEQINSRPHLWTPAGNSWAWPASSLPAIPPNWQGCVQAPHAQNCLARRSRTAVLQQDLSGAVGACRAISSTLWSEECLFVAAESWLGEQPFFGYGTAVQICLEAGNFREDCLFHLSLVLADQVSADPAMWVQQDALVQQIRAQWASQDLQDALVDHFWAKSALLAFSRAGVVQSFPSQDSRSVPHQRAAAALLLVDGRPLMEQVSTIEEALSGEMPVTIRNAAMVEPMRSRSGDGDIVHVAGGHRRLGGAPDLDAAICLVEAAMLQDPVNWSVVVAASEHRDQMIRQLSNHYLEGRR